MSVNYIYLLQEREFIKTNENIYKVGMTKQNNHQRFNQYPKGSILLLQLICNDCVFIEKQLLNIFKETFIKRIDIGNEYFEGDYKHMNKIICELINNEEEIKDNEEKLIINGNKTQTVNDSCKNINTQYICENCDYKTYIKIRYNKHLMSSSHKEMNNQFFCKKCDYKTLRKYNFNKHLNSNIHKNTKKSIIKKCVIENGNKIFIYDCLQCKNVFYSKVNYLRHLMNCNTDNVIENNETNNIIISDTNVIKMNEKNKQDIYRCELCNYICHHKCNYNRHLSTKKHFNEMTKMKEDIKVKTEDKKHFICSICNFECDKKSNYNIHLLSKKHIQNIKEQEQEQSKEINKNVMNVQSFKNDVISTLMNQMNLIHKTSINKHPSTVKKQFNMNLFLNETCKNAMNLNEFIKNFKVSIEDIEKISELRLAKGISWIIIKNINLLDVYKLPFHCSDVKRKTLHVKNNGIWEKEIKDRKSITEFIHNICNLNEIQLIKWRGLPNDDKSENTNIEINKLSDKDIDNIITSISKNVTIYRCI
jgi:hypothetical protein